MPRFRMEIRDPDSGETVHICTHVQYGRNWYDAILRFVDPEHGYPFKEGQWRFLAKELDAEGNPLPYAPPRAARTRR